MRIDMDWPAGTTVASHPAGFDLVVTPDPGNDGWIFLTYVQGVLMSTVTYELQGEALESLQRTATLLTVLAT